MDKVPWVGNGWVQLTHAQLWLGMGTVVKPNAGLCFTPLGNDEANMF